MVLKNLGLPEFCLPAFHEPIVVFVTARCEELKEKHLGIERKLD